MHWDFALILAFLGIAIPWLGQRRVRPFMQADRTTRMDRLSLYVSTMLFQWLAAGVILWRTNNHGIHLAKLGLAVADARLVGVTSVLLCVFILANQVFGLRRMLAHPLEVKGALPHLVKKLFPQDDIERWVFFGLIVSVALCEEFIYRGFVQRAFEDWLGGSMIVGMVLSAIFFALAHLYQGRRGMVSTFVVGLLFSAMREWTGSLVPSMAAHFVANLAVGFLGPHCLRGPLVSARDSKREAPGAQELGVMK